MDKEAAPFQQTSNTATSTFSGNFGTLSGCAVSPSQAATITRIWGIATCLHSLPGPFTPIRGARPVPSSPTADSPPHSLTSPTLVLLQ